MEGDTILASLEDILSSFTKFYSDLFTTEDVGGKMEDARNLIKTLIPKKVSVEEAEILGKLVTSEEIKLSILSLKNEKAPGPDGLLVEFYKRNIEWICEELREVYLWAF